MNFTALQAATVDRVGLGSNDAAIGAGNTGQLAQCVRHALNSVATAYAPGWDWLRRTASFNLVVGQDAYTFIALQILLSIPVEIHKIHEVRMTAPATGSGVSYPLERVSRTEADTMFPYTTNQIPQVWWAEGRTFGVSPAPDSTYPMRLTVLTGETDLTAGGDIPIMPASYHDVIVDKAAETFFRRLHNLPDAQVAGSAANERLKEMVAHQRPYTGAGHVRVRAGGYQ